MRTSDIREALTGKILMEQLKSSKDSRKAIAEGFLYEHTIVMVAADPGVGKSTISTQIAIELSSGLPILGLYRVERPQKVLYIQTERPILEFLERAYVINSKLPINFDTLVVTDEYKVLNLLNFEHVLIFIDCIKRDCPDVDVIFVDPIYPMVSGGLSKDEPASAFTKALSLVQKETGALLYYNHHTSRPMHNSEGIRVEKDDPFYGSQWLKAHVTASYYMKESETGVKMVRKKDNYKIMPREILLEYDPETELCHIPLAELSPIDRVRAFVKHREIDKKQFYFSEIQEETKLCTRTLRKLIMHSSLSGHFIVVSSIKNKNLYQIAPAQ